ncbi:MAG TPA: hypothetical protein VFG19_01960 [Geobacteraceae bacterium]|nr:hypothetical protein [Geobacteraceae bacterium]
MRKPRKPDDLVWTNKCIAWIDMTAEWSFYLGEVVIPRAYDDTRALWMEGNARSDGDRVMSAGFRVYGLLVLARRISAYRCLVSGEVRFPLTGADVFALLSLLKSCGDAFGGDSGDIAGTLRRLLEDIADTDALSRVFDHVVAYCRNFLVWEMSAPRLGANRQCLRCGRCCKDLWDAYDFTASGRDILLWSLHGRWDIIERIDWTVWHCWLSPETGKKEDTCPWLRKNRHGSAFSCGIDEVKPRHCRILRGCPRGKPGQSAEKALQCAETAPGNEKPVISDSSRG